MKWRTIQSATWAIRKRNETKNLFVVAHLIYLMACYLRHTYPDIFESASYPFRIRLPSTCIRWIQHTNPQLFESALQSGNFWIRYNESRIVWTQNPDIFLSGDVTRSSPILYREYCIQDGNLVPRWSLLPVEGEVGKDPGNEVVHGGCRLKTHALLSILPEVSWVLEWIRIRMGYVWTSKFDLNTCGRGNFYNPKRKSCGFKNIRIRVDGA